VFAIGGSLLLFLLLTCKNGYSCYLEDLTARSGRWKALRGGHVALLLLRYSDPQY
jgi:hypothetical protein